VLECVGADDAAFRHDVEEVRVICHVLGAAVTVRRECGGKALGAAYAEIQLVLAVRPAWHAEPAPAYRQLGIHRAAG
jgi:hypothetical protein